MNREWTEADNAKLVALLTDHTLSYADIGRKLQRTRAAIWTQVSKMGLSNGNTDRNTLKRNVRVTYAGPRSGRMWVGFVSPKHDGALPPQLPVPTTARDAA